MYSGTGEVWRAAAVRW